MDEHLQNNVFTIIDSAIRRQLVIQIKLDSTWRTVEPYQLGIHESRQAHVVYGYCRDFIPTCLTQTRWQVFNLAGIESIELTNYSFQQHVEYKGCYDFMQTVYRRLLPMWTELQPGCLPIRNVDCAIRRIRLSKRLGNKS